MSPSPFGKSIQATESLTCSRPLGEATLQSLDHLEHQIFKTPRQTRDLF